MTTGNVRSVQRETYEYLIDGKQIYSFSEPEGFKDCKERKYSPDTVGHSLKFKHDIFNNILKISNHTDKPITKLTVRYKKPFSNFDLTHDTDKNVPSNEEVTWNAWTAFTISKGDEITELIGYHATVVTCEAFFSDYEKAELKRKDEEAQKAKRRIAEMRHKQKIIFDNCLADKLPKTNNVTLTKSIVNICDRIAGKPELVA